MGDAADRARASLPPRVVVTGSESAGKTTLAHQLAGALGTIWVPEFSRTYAQRVQRPLTAGDVEPIARGQLLDEASAVDAWRTMFATGVSPPPLVLDTDLVSTTVYAEHYYGETPAWIVAEARARLADLYLLCEPDLPWEADGIRDSPRERLQLHAAFRDRLHDWGARVVSVRGVGPLRLSAALQAVRSTFDRAEQSPSRDQAE